MLSNQIKGRKNLTTEISTCSTTRSKPVVLNYSSLHSINNLNDKISSTKNELLNLNKEDKLTCDIESKRLINRSNLRAYSPKNAESQKSFSNTLNIFKSKNEKNDKIDTSSLANRIFNRNKSPLKGEREPLSSTLQKQSKMELFKASNDILFNPKRHLFAERKIELMNILKHKNDEERMSSPSNKTKHYGFENKLDTFIEKNSSLSLKQMDTNLKYSKIDFCTYYSSQPKIKKTTNLNDYNFSRSHNQMAKLLTKYC